MSLLSHFNTLIWLYLKERVYIAYILLIIPLRVVLPSDPNVVFKVECDLAYQVLPGRIVVPDLEKQLCVLVLLARQVQLELVLLIVVRALVVLEALSFDDCVLGLLVDGDLSMVVIN